MDQKLPLIIAISALVISILFPIFLFLGVKLYINSFLPQIDSTITFLEKFSNDGIEANIPISTSFPISQNTLLHFNKTIVINGTPFELNEDIPVNIDTVIPIELTLNLKINASQLGMKEQVNGILILLRKIRDFAR